MPTVAITFVEQGAGPVANMRVTVFQYDFSTAATPVADGTTGADGKISIDLPLFGLLSASFYQVRARSSTGRDIWRSALFSAESGTKELGTISLPGADLRGLLVTNRTGTVSRLSAENSVMLLTDNAVAWAELETGVIAANKGILLQLFYFDVGHTFLRFDPDPPALNTPTTGARLEDLLLAANRKSSAVSVRLLIRDVIGLPYPLDTADQVQSFFSTQTPNTVAVRPYPTDGRLPMHAKFVVIDDAIGYIIGSPLLQEYFDAGTHAIEDHRRGTMSSRATASGLAQSKNSIREPIHDVSCKITGPAVGFMRDTFYEHWNLVGSKESDSTTPPAGPAPHTGIQIVRTLTGGTFPNLPDGETGIFEAYLRAFENATQYVYLENQYLLCPEIFDGIRLALKNKSGLEFILLINNRVDLPTYPWRQPIWIRQLLDDVKKDGTADRLALFCLWSHETTPTQRIIGSYVHSKVAIVDDVWATIGSANLDGVSMNTSDFNLRPQDLHAESRRSTEVNALFFNGVEGQSASTVPTDLRLRLWSEHLGMASTDSRLTTRPSGGWRSLWRGIAAQKLNGLKANPPQAATARILPFRSEADSTKFLQASGVDTRPFQVLEQVPSFDFNTGKPVP